MPKKALGLAKQYQDADEDGRKFMLDGLPYETGYMKPPAQHRFQPGNKMGKGRPKGSENIKQMMAEELDNKIAVKENGRTRKLPAGRVMYRQIVNAGVQGDKKASALAFDLARKHGALVETPPEISAPLLSPEDFETFRRFEEILAGSVLVGNEPEDQER